MPRTASTSADATVSPWPLLEGAVAVYTVSSQMGFEAILAGHRPRVFGQPFYAGWGLTEDEDPVPRRRAHADPGAAFRRRDDPLSASGTIPTATGSASSRTVLDALEAQARAWREDRQAGSAAGMRLWKRGRCRGSSGSEKRVRLRRRGQPRALREAEGGPRRDGLGRQGRTRH